MPVTELRAPAHLVSRRARLFWTVRALPAWLVAAAVLTLVLLGAEPSRAVVTTLIAVFALAALAHLVVMPQWRFRVHRWELTEDAVYTQSGWLTQERRIAPLARVQTVDTHRGPIEQLFGLANVTVTTASARGPVKIHALDAKVAEDVAQWVTVRAQASSGDAT